MTQSRDNALTSLENYPESPVRESMRRFADFVLERNK